MIAGIACFNPCCIGLDNDAVLSVSAGRASFRVSILVVLDWTMMHRRPQGPPGGPLGFNPCCIGLDNDAGLSVTFNTSLSEVSILVVLDWTMMRRVATILRHCYGCFNPCCIGLDNDASRCRSIASTSEMFQSLLYWIGQ